jgi:predicted amidophosphoribosyltransferase
MKYNCRYCKKELDTMLSIMRCPTCKTDVNESIEIADRLWQEEQRELKADRERRGIAFTEHRGPGRRDDGF